MPFSNGFINFIIEGQLKSRQISYKYVHQPRALNCLFWFYDFNKSYTRREDRSLWRLRV